MYTDIINIINKINNLSIENIGTINDYKNVEKNVALINKIGELQHTEFNKKVDYIEEYADLLKSISHKYKKLSINDKKINKHKLKSILLKISNSFRRINNINKTLKIDIDKQVKKIKKNNNGINYINYIPDFFNKIYSLTESDNKLEITDLEEITNAKIDFHKAIDNRIKKDNNIAKCIDNKKHVDLERKRESKCIHNKKSRGHLEKKTESKCIHNKKSRGHLEKKTESKCIHNKKSRGHLEKKKKSKCIDNKKSRGHLEKNFIYNLKRISKRQEKDEEINDYLIEKSSKKSINDRHTDLKTNNQVKNKDIEEILEFKQNFIYNLKRKIKESDDEEINDYIIDKKENKCVNENFKDLENIDDYLIK